VDLLGWVIFLVALLFSVMWHETGHFVMAKRFGMKVTRYFVGFGPTLWSIQRGETEYGIKALPFGGFVKIVGMTSLDEVDDPADEPRSFRSHPAWQRIIVLCAGSFMHCVLAFVLFLVLLLGLGIQTPSNAAQFGAIIPCVASNATALADGVCTASNPPSPATLAGVRAGEKVLAFNGTPVSNWTQLSKAIGQAGPGARVTITVVRDGKTVTLHATLAAVKGRRGGFLGIDAPYVYIPVSPVRAVQDAGSAFGQVLVGSAQEITALPGAVHDLFNKKKRAESAAGQVTSVVGLANDTGQEVAANVGWQAKVSFVLLLTAELNIFFGAFNLLPLLPMDGGHVAAIIWERIRAWFARLRGRPDPGLVDMTKFLPVSFSIFAILILFSVALIAADIVNPVNIAG
jgi:membrane-associated protease RseP (regulator of RpoE activity)